MNGRERKFASGRFLSQKLTRWFRFVPDTGFIGMNEPGP